jgi:DNA-binding Lrp family transcriptional regulator
MDAKEAMIISSLRQNAREKLTSISRKTGTPVSTIYERIKQQQLSIIKKFTALLNFANLGYSCRANICLKARKETREELAEYLMKHQNTNSMYKINNGYDFLLEVIFKDIRELEDFLEAVDERFKLKGKQVYYIIDDIVRENFMTQPEFMDVIAVR